jgi:Ni/Co efflux regulator RcnB
MIAIVLDVIARRVAATSMRSEQMNTQLLIENETKNNSTLESNESEKQKNRRNRTVRSQNNNNNSKCRTIFSDAHRDVFDVEEFARLGECRVSRIAANELRLRDAALVTSLVAIRLCE